MLKNKVLNNNKINFINYFIIKKDRERIDPKLLLKTRTHKIYSYKEGDKKYLKEIVTWVAKTLKRERIIIIPYPSTRKYKKRDNQLPFCIVKELSKIYDGWIDGSGILYRKYSLPKNTRNTQKQYKSLEIANPNVLKGEKVLIFDDVYTSGSSLKAAIKKIKEAKPADVKSIAIARKVYIRDIPLSGIY